MNHAQGRITVANGVGNHAHGKEVVNLVDRAMLAQALLMDGIKPLDPALDFRGDSIFFQALANGVLQFLQEGLKFLALGNNGFLQFLVGLRLEVAKCKVFQFAANQAHPQAMRNRGVNIERLPRDALLFFGRKKTQRAHVVQAVGKLDHNDANVVDHGQEHLADVFGLAGFGSQKVQAADFRDAFDQTGDVRTKALDDPRRGNARVLDHIVQQGRA